MSQQTSVSEFLKGCPAELRFLLENAGDTDQQLAVLNAYKTFAQGSADSIAVKAGVFGAALLKANLKILEDVSAQIQQANRNQASLLAAVERVQMRQRAVVTTTAVCAGVFSIIAFLLLARIL